MGGVRISLPAFVRLSRVVVRKYFGTIPAAGVARYDGNRSTGFDCYTNVSVGVVPAFRRR